MKIISLIAAASAFSLVACAQNIPASQAPALVINAFQAHYPKAGDVEWERKGNVYEVEFETGLMRADHKMLIDSTGKIVYHKMEISESDLPPQVKKVILTKFPGFRIDDLDKIENGDKITYVAELKKRPEEWKIIFAPDGTILEQKQD